MTITLPGRVMSAMVTPMHTDGSVDLDSTKKLAAHLVEGGHDGLVINGTTGESPTTTDAEKVDILRAVREAVGDDVTIIAGAGTNVTEHSVQMARQAQDAGADGLLVVTPYYNKPPRAGLLEHFTTVADATDLPVMIYDIPGRSGVPVPTDLLIELAAHPKIWSVKDAKGDLFAANEVMCATDLVWFSGDDPLNVAHLAQGARGIISVVAQLASRPFADLVAAVEAGDLAKARDLHRSLTPLIRATMMVSQGAIQTKAALAATGVIPQPTMRRPLVEAPPADTDLVVGALRELGAR